MSKYIYATLNQGRTDNVTIEVDTLTDAESFFSLVSTANLTKAKEIVYSKDLNVNFVVRGFTPLPFDNELHVSCVTESNSNNIVILRNTKQGLTESQIETSISNFLRFDEENIIDFNSILIR